MLCSVSAGKSGSRWLDRLRNAKGFSDDGATDLENFLQNIDSSNQENSDPSPTSNPELDPIGNDDNQLFTIMSDVLNELFNFGGNCSTAAKLKKSARKQANPRICAFSNNGSDENNNAASEKAMVSRNGDSNSGVEGVKRLAIRENEGEEDGREGNLSGFSRTEVTVIDTSYEQWKFEKLLYRKKNVWKVRDRKGKSESVGNKRKRKVDMAAREEQPEGKKQKIDEKKGCGEESELQLNEVLSVCYNNLLMSSNGLFGFDWQASSFLRVMQASKHLKFTFICIDIIQGLLHVLQVYHQSNKPEAHEKVPDKLGKELGKWKLIPLFLLRAFLSARKTEQTSPKAV
ncbi:UNVERIFIED_CONTAM: hypothetical protein Slati_4083000 [Sesamum latifolium]|uniref:Uncharacterized protein n=1 Tax=Sesamum latifolium TaxID=2727402 RepID=A0AAW2TA80_9LAMI